MKSNYKPLGKYIQPVIGRNNDIGDLPLVGLSIQKKFITSIANTIGTDMSTYRIIERNQFAYGPVTSRNGDKITIALFNDYEKALISQAYIPFEVKDSTELDPEYLMMWFRRPEFDRYARFKSHGSAREIFGWDEMCNTELPIPSIEKQREIVAEYNTVKNRITLNNQLIQKLEETAQAIYKQWFVDFEFPDENGKPYKSTGGKMVWCEELGKEIPDGWKLERLKNRCSKIGSGSTPKGGKEGYKESGISLIRSLNIHDFNFLYKDLALIDNVQAKKLNNVQLLKGDLLLNITGVSVARCCIVPPRVLPARVNQHVSIIRLNKSEYEANYLLCALCSTDYKQKLLGTSESGSTRQAITKEDIEKFEVLFPENEILKSFNRKIQIIMDKKELKNEEIQKLDELMKLLLAKMTKVETEKEAV